MIQKILLATILILIVLGQILLLFVPTLGLFMNALLIVVLCSSMLYDKPDLFAQDVLAISAIIPVISIISISSGIKDVFYLESLIIIMLIVISVFYLWDFRLPEHPLRIDTIKNLHIIVPVVLSSEAVYLFFKHTQNLNSLFSIYMLIIFLISLSIGETLYFFALTQNLVSDMGGKLTGIIYTTILFTLFQTNNSPYNIIFYGILGLVLTCIYKYSSNIFLIGFIIFSVQLTFYLSSGTILPLTLH